MLFEFLKYLLSTHYFQKLTLSGSSIYPKPSSLPENIQKLLKIDVVYTSQVAQDYDLSWQAIQKGYIGLCETYSTFEKLPLKDNYHFVRKYFHPAWVFYILILRLLSFKNPFKELRAWTSTRHVKRHLYYKKPLVYAEWDSFDSGLVKRGPKVSVVIPTLNRYDVLKDVLADLERQDYENFEVIVVDQSDNFNASFYEDFDLEIQLIRQEEKALWLARNTAIKKANGELIALSEDDVRIESDWLKMHIKCLDFFGSQVSAGVFYPEGQQIPVERSYFAIASQFATGNAMLYKDVFNYTGLFDRQFEKQRMGDGEFGMRLYLNGIKSISNPYAHCIDIKAPTGGLREMGSWDAFRTKGWTSPRPIPSVLYFFRRYFGYSQARYALLKNIPPSVIPYRFKGNKLLLPFGLLLMLLKLPLILWQVYKSWNLSSKKLKEGPLIEYLE